MIAGMINGFVLGGLLGVVGFFVGDWEFWVILIGISLVTSITKHI